MRRFDPADLPEVHAWQRAHGQDEAPLAAYSQTGFIVPGVAAGWMYSTDSAIALCEGYISNPDADPAARGEALDAITAAIIDEALARGFKWVLAYSTSNALNVRGINNHGFRVSRQATALVRAL